MTVYTSPGNADALDSNLLTEWNATIQRAYESQPDSLKSRYFTLDAEAVGGAPINAIRWFADPAEPAFCLSAEAAQLLSDWGVRGRHLLHNEYCEYSVVSRVDAAGKLRPKRVELTTELREYWAMLAVMDPEWTRVLAESILKEPVTHRDLYGVDDPLALSPRERLVAFSTFTAGHGNDNELVGLGVPSQPTGRTNTARALFMTHPINGLDDLLYIVMFGARPYARSTPAGLEPTTREQLFRQFSVEQLACRHADPAAAMGAYAAAFEGKPVAFANPIGMYITSFAQASFRYGDDAVPDEWVRWSRGQEGWYQRLEFGPGDDSPAFLDEILVAEGANLTPLTGGFHVAAKVEVGPRVLVGPGTPIQPHEYVVLDASTAPIKCSEAAICDRIQQLKDEYDAGPSVVDFVRTGPRTMGPA